jgi:hypothetical protein
MSLGAKVSSTRRSSSLIRGSGYDEPGFNSGGPQKKLVYCALWDDSVDGHLPVQVSNGGMGLGVFVPANFFVTIINFEVMVVPVGPTNMGWTLEADFDLSASAAISGAPWSAAGMKNGANLGASAVEVAQTVQGPRTTVTREIQLVATVAVSSAGRAAIWVEGYQSSAKTQGIS